MSNRNTTVEVSVETLDALIDMQSELEKVESPKVKALLSLLIEDLKSADEMELYRVCDECSKLAREGYVIESCEFYCSKQCLHQHVSAEEFEKLYADGEGDSYWTDWY